MSILSTNINNNMICDATCKDEKMKSELLYMNYVDAQENLKNAPIKLNEAEKDYYVTTFGQAKYDDLKLDQYKDEINDIIIKERTEFNNNIDNINEQIDNYKKNILLDEKLNDLIDIITKENESLNEKIESITSNINTNERKVYYDDKQILNIKNIKRGFMYLLFVIYIAFLIILIVKKELLNIKIVILFTVLFIMPYFFIPYISRYIIHLYYFITNKKNI